MKNGKMLWLPALEIALGAALIVLCKLFDWDARWLGAGSAVMTVALLHLIQGLRYRKDARFREQYDTESQDERNVYIRQMAWTWAGTAFIFIGGILTIVFLILKNEALTRAASGAVCLLLVLYWGCWLMLRKKY